MAGGGIDPSKHDPNKDYPGKLTAYVICTCLVAAMGGLIFGYDIGISGGVTSMEPFLKQFFLSVYRKEALDQSTNQYCKFNDVNLTMFTSSLYLAALLASLGASHFTRKLGRKNSMLSGSAIFFAGAIVNCAAQNIAMLIIGRILLGVGLGFSIQSVPLYLSEMAPHKHRGALNVVFQLAITIGILIANVVNYFTSEIKGGFGWRISLGGAAVPAAFIFIGALFLPDTPNSILERGDSEGARTMLQKIRGINYKEVEAEFNDLVVASEASKQVEHPWRNVPKRSYRPQVTMAIAIPFFQQFTGINVVMFYAPVLFKSIGFGDDASLMSAVITGVINFLATFISVYVTDKWGRRPLFFWGGGLMFVFQLAVAGFIGWKFGVSGVVNTLPNWYAGAVVTCICVFVAAFAFSWGPLGWLVPSEIFPLEIRSAAQSITVSVNMLCTFVIAQAFLPMLCLMKFGLFIFFSFFVGLMTVFILGLLPETKNKPIEEMSNVWKKHWYWERYVTKKDSAKTGPVEIV